MNRFSVNSLAFAIALSCASARAATPVEDLRAEVDALRNDLRADSAQLELERRVELTPPLDYAIAKPGPKLQINGLVQVWFQSIQNDSRGIVGPTNHNLLPYAEPNGTNDNDTFRIRRTELRFELDLDKHVHVHMLLDPARETNIEFTPIPTFPRHNTFISDPVATGKGQQSSPTKITPQVLQDANIVITDMVPHHSLTFGQFKPPSGEEAWRDSGYLNFVERAMCTSISNVRDIGFMVQGSWFPAVNKGPARLEYALGLFNGPSGTVLSDPEIVEGGNRADDNNSKDFAWRILGRPVWDKTKWYGRLETGVARTDGRRGDSGSRFADALAFSVSNGVVLNSLNQAKTAIKRQSAWFWYRPANVTSGWWIRGEYDSGHDSLNESRLKPTSLFGLGGDIISTQIPGTAQLDAAPVTASGWYLATGYLIGESIFAKRLAQAKGPLNALNNFEFAFRVESYENVAGENPANTDRSTLLFSTRVYTMGVNYYLKGSDIRKAGDAKIQLNYDLVRDPHNNDLGLRDVRNNAFVVSFQVGF